MPLQASRALPLIECGTLNVTASENYAGLL